MKKLALILAALTLVFSLTACGSKEEAPADEEDNTAVEEQVDAETETEGEEDAEAAEDETEAETEDENAADAEEAVYTGIIEEKKDFMVIVTSEDGADAYVFNLGEDVTCEAEEGDKVTVTYTGDLDDIDATLVASKIEKVA